MLFAPVPAQALEVRRGEFEAKPSSARKLNKPKQRKQKLEPEAEKGPFRRLDRAMIESARKEQEARPMHLVGATSPTSSFTTETFLSKGPMTPEAAAQSEALRAAAAAAATTFP